MAKQGYADITIILDRSGSMGTIWPDTVGGLAKLVEDQRAVPGECTLTLAAFDDKYDVPIRATPVRDVRPMAEALKDFGPRGSTALLDAVGRGIVETGERLSKLAEADRPEKVIFVISTDGGENASKEYTRARVAEMVKHQTDAYAWEFIYLGANQDAFAIAGAIGVPHANAMNFAANRAATANYLNAVSSGLTRSRTGGAAAFTGAERAAAMVGESK